MGKDIRLDLLGYIIEKNLVPQNIRERQLISDLIDFTVKRWAELPDLPEDLAAECRKAMHEDL